MESNKADFQPNEVISPEEEKFERWRNKTGLFLGPLVFLVFYFLPYSSITYQAHTLSAILLWVIVWWITEPVPLPITALFGAVLCVIFNVADVKKIFIPFADPIVFLFLGSFILAEAMAKHGIDKRFAYKILTMKYVGKSTGRIIFVFGAITAFISMWISNTAATAMMLPIAIGIVASIHKIIQEEKGIEIDSKKLKFGTAMMLMTAYSASIGGIGTPVGTPPNLIGIAMIEKFANFRISFFEWMMFALPMLLVMYIFLFIVIYFMNKPEISKINTSSSVIQTAKDKLGKFKIGEINSIIAFFITVILWIIPGFLAVIYGTDSPFFKTFNNHFPEAIAALIGASLLFVLPVSRKKLEFTVSWKDAVNIDWGTLILFGGGLSLGNLMFETKLADYLGNSFIGFSGLDTVWGITFVSIYIAIIVSEATSNTASANMIVPVVISICIAGNMNPIPPAIGATLGASWGFMLPVSTPPNAIVYGSGLVPITKMIRSGIVFDVIGGVLIWAMLRLILPLLHLG
jgi:solute carrier family 13 (sodium-dependent dicarboxylate transporter), member 2/3/5